MTSQINPNLIDITYPVAGVDNDSQGFRDQFTNIKSNFSAAESEISDLQSKVILKSALSGDTLNNDFGQALVSNAKIVDFSEVVTDNPAATGSLAISHLNGHYQTISLAGAVSITFSDWAPAGTLGRIRLAITVSNTAHTVTLPAEVTIGNELISGLNGQVLTFRNTGTFIYEFTTADAGTTIAISNISAPQASNAFRTITTSIGTAGDKQGDIAFDSSFIYVCLADYDGVTDIWDRAPIINATW